MFGHTLTLAVLVPLLATGGFLLLVLAWPQVEETLTGDRTRHDALDRAREVPTRTGLGVAGLVFYCTLWLAGSADLIATEFALSFNAVIMALQAMILVGPVLAFVITRHACHAVVELERHRRDHGVESGVVVRLPRGGYIEMPVDPPTRAELADGARINAVEAS